MSKSTVTRLFVGSLIALVAGIVVAGGAVLVAFAGGVFVMDGADVVGVRGTSIAWSMLGVGILGALAIIAGGLGQLVAWIGALLNTSRLEDKTWFVLLLVLGLLSFGFVAMLVYVFVGPDGTRAPAHPLGGQPVMGPNR
jgi:hypothetical protein